MTDDGLDAARDLLPRLRLEITEQLDGSGRSLVQRVGALAADGAAQSLIVKQYDSAGEGWARESAALDAMSGTPHVPRLIAHRSEPQVLVLQDLGSGPSLADALLGDDPHAARAGLTRWATAVGSLHAASRDRRPSFVQALAGRAGDLPIDESTMPGAIHDAVRVLDEECGALGVRVPAQSLDDLRAVAHRLGSDGAAALSPADTCPDNNVLVGERLVLIDFEGAQWRHVAWDVAYLRVPWPTCWCSWVMPGDVVDEAVGAYRRAASVAFPEVEADAFDEQVSTAVVAWSLVSATWYLRSALDADHPSSRAPDGPTRRTSILNRLDRAAATAALSSCADLAGLLADELRSRWGDLRLDLAPAFRTGDRSGPRAQ